jgi:3-oxoacyl-[acyl-carrier-protein] synthase I
VPGLANDLRGRARLVELLALAFEYARPRLPPELAWPELPLFLCTREPGRPGARINRIMAEVEARQRIEIRRDGSRHVASGPVSAFEALAQVRTLLAEGQQQACLVAAVDTLIDARALHWLDRAQRLKTQAQSDGVIPGEAACVALVSKKPITQSWLVIRGLGFAVEEATVSNEEPLLGKGMAAAVKEALSEAGFAMHEVDLRLSDVAGESYAFEELALAQSRLARNTRESQDLWHPADTVGDCGAASGLIQIAWAEQAFARGYAPGPTALLHGSAATGARAAGSALGMMVATR